MNMALREPERDAAITAGTGPKLARIEIAHEIEAFAPLWRSLERHGVASPYQHFHWVRLWDEAVSRPQHQVLLIVAGFDAAGEALFLWPLLRGKLGPFRTASFFGGKHATLNVGLWSPRAAFDGADMRAALQQLASRAPDLDFLTLFAQPQSWNGFANPFALLPRHRSTEDNFILNLAGRPGKEVIESELSGSMRSRLRNKERKLAKLSSYRYLRAATAAEVDWCLDAFFAQKAAKLAALGLDNVFAHPGVEAFVRAACHEGLDRGSPVIELHALAGDGEMLALFSGIHDGRRYTSMFNSHTGSDHARYSPGLILLQHLIVDCADRGFEVFDIGPGEARYKTFFCKTFEPIFDSILPLSPRAKLAASAVRGLFALKSEIKHNPALWSAASFVRRTLNRSRREPNGSDD